MAFETATTATPVSIGRIRIWFSENPGVEERSSFDIEIVYDDGHARNAKGNLAKHLSVDQIAQIRAFMTAMRTKAEAEILP